MNRSTGQLTFEEAPGLFLLGRRKAHFQVALLGGVIFTVGLVVPFTRTEWFTLWSSLCVAYCVYTACLLTAQRNFLFASLSIFLTYGVATVWVANYLLAVPMSSWRVGWEQTEQFPEAIGQAILYLTYFSALAILVTSRAPAYPLGPPAPLDGDRYQLAVTVLTVASAGAMLVIAGTKGRDQYLATADLGSMFVVQASSIMLSALFAFALFFIPAGTYRRGITLILVGTAALVGMNGFRFVLVIFAFVWLFYILATRKLRSRQVLTLTIVGILAYLGLLCLAYTRSLGMTFGATIDFLIQPDVNAALAYLGGADQVNLVALDYYLDRTDTVLSGRTYFDAFLRLAPNFVHTSLFETIRGQDYIIQTATFVPERFRENNWTVGSHLFVEAIINFGKLGPYLVLSVVVAAMVWLNRMARKSPALLLGCLVTAAMGYSLAWYGFTNSLKQGVFAVLCCLVIARVTGLSKRDQVSAQDIA